MNHQNPSSATPEAIFEALSAHQLTAAIKTAIELDLFTAIGAGAQTPSAIAAQSDASERGIRILSDYLVTAGFLEKNDGKYRLSQDSAAFLDRRSPSYIGGVASFLCGPTLIEAFQDLTSVVRKGGTLLKDNGTVRDENPVWDDFARSMAAIARPTAQIVAEILGVAEQGPMKVLDIAAGHGMYGITIAAQNAQAEVWALDWPSVLEIARQNADAAGVADRYHLLPGSAFETEFGNGFDLVLVTNFYHHFELEKNQALARRIYDSLKPGGRMATLEFVPNEDRVTPIPSARFSLVMLSTTEQGDAYTFAEYREIFEGAGFKENKIFPCAVQQLIVSHNPN